jgi:hypothetical protein
MGLLLLQKWIDGITFDLACCRERGEAVSREQKRDTRQQAIKTVDYKKTKYE